MPRFKLVLNNGGYRKDRYAAVSLVMRSAASMATGIPHRVLRLNKSSNLTASTNGTDSILNVPDAAAAARGVVNTAAQTFAGNKPSRIA